MSEYPLDLEQHDIRGVLSGRKTQLRLILDWQPSALATPTMDDDGRWYVANAAGHRTDLQAPWLAGDRVWIREHHATTSGGPLRYLATDDVHELRRVLPPSALSRTFSRLTLEIVRVRIEKIASISPADAKAEGLELDAGDPPYWHCPELWPRALTAVRIDEAIDRPPAVASYGKLFDLQHGKGAFDENPWVAVIEFSAHRLNITQAPSSSMDRISKCA